MLGPSRTPRASRVGDERGHIPEVPCHGQGRLLLVGDGMDLGPAGALGTLPVELFFSSVRRTCRNGVHFR
jgi:hypothetical protein